MLGHLELFEIILDYEIEVMDLIEAQEEEPDDDDDDDSDEESLGEDEGYTDEIDFEARDLWFFGINPVLGRIQL